MTARTAANSDVSTVVQATILAGEADAEGSSSLTTFLWTAIIFLAVAAGVASVLMLRK